MFARSRALLPSLGYLKPGRLQSGHTPRVFLMVDPPKSARKSGVVIICGVLVGSLLGAPLGAYLLTPKNSLRNHPDPQAKAMGIFLYPCEILLTTVGLSLGVFVGGTIGGVVSSLALERRTSASPQLDSADPKTREQGQ
jgi:hypothetical protein